MKKLLLSIGLFLSAGMTAWAQAPQLFNYQGVARTTAGMPMVSATIGLRLTIHDVSATGAVLYQETQTASTNSFGLYSLSVGGGTPVSGTMSSIAWGSGLKYLQVEIDPTGGTSYAGGGTAQLLSVPYAVYANSANTAATATSATSATSITGTVPMGGDVTGTNAAATVVKMQGHDISSTAPTSGQALIWNSGSSSWTPTTLAAGGTVTSITASAPLTGGTITSSGSIGLGTAGTAGNYGDGTHYPAFTTDAYGRVTAVTVNALPAGITSTGTANYVSKFTSPTAITNSSLYQNGSKIGLGTTAPNGTLTIESAADSILLYVNQTGTPTPFGMQRLVYNGATDGSRCGIYARTIRTTADATGTGILAIGSDMGLYGYSSSSTNTECEGLQGDAYNSGTYSIGVYGYADKNTTSPGSAYGVYGFAQNGTVNYAGYFDGDLYAANASAGIKAFKIDHPADPANKYLYHSSVESNDMMNMYNGNVVTDENGDATVALPSYFTLLNKDYKYQLTCMGQFAQAIIAEKISDNQFKIKTDKPNVEVSWLVMGVRQDPAANAYRIKNEVEKPSSEKGTYLFPELYGYGPDKSPAGKAGTRGRGANPHLSEPLIGTPGSNATH